MLLSRLLLLLLFTALGTLPAHAGERIIGMLSVPSIFAYTEEVTETPTLPVYESADLTSPVIATASRDIVTSPLADDFYLSEVAYEENGFDVTERKGAWYKIVLRHTKSTDTNAGWIMPPKDAVYTDLGDFLQQALLEFSPAWDGVLYMVPGAPEQVVINQDNPKVTGLDISTLTELNGEVWARVHLRNLCTEDEKVYGDGWVKLPHDWRTLLYHYSRGC